MNTWRMWLEARFWDIHSLTWDSGVPPGVAAGRTGRVVARLIALRGRSGERVLDIGCATGRHAAALAATGFQVTAVDLSPGMLRRARRNTDRLERSPTFVCVDANRPLPFADCTFERVLCSGVLQCAHQPVATLAELHRVLVPRGILLLAVKTLGAPAARPATLAAWLFAPLKRLASRHVRHLSLEDVSRLVTIAGFASHDACIVDGLIELKADR